MPPNAALAPSEDGATQADVAAQRAALATPGRFSPEIQGAIVGGDTRISGGQGGFTR
jgi:hypothetical protein